MLIEHKAPLPCQTQQMHTSMAQLTGIHPVEVGGILKIRLHIAIIFSRMFLAQRSCVHTCVVSDNLRSSLHLMFHPLFSAQNYTLF